MFYEWSLVQLVSAAEIFNLQFPVAHGSQQAFVNPRWVHCFNEEAAIINTCTKRLSNIVRWPNKRLSNDSEASHLRVRFKLGAITFTITSLYLFMCINYRQVVPVIWSTFISIL